MFDPRQTVQPVHLPEYLGLHADGAGNSLHDTFDPRQTVQPVYPPTLFGLQEMGEDDNFDIFDPRQTAQLVHPHEYFGLQADGTDNSFSDMSDMFNRWHTAQPILPSNTLPSQFSSGDGTIKTHRELQSERNVHNPPFPSVDLAAHCS